MAATCDTRGSRTSPAHRAGTELWEDPAASADDLRAVLAQQTRYIRELEDELQAGPRGDVQEAGKSRAVLRLRLQIAADPEAFLMQADADESGDVSRDEFDKLCQSVLAKDSEEHEQRPMCDSSALSSLFNELGPDTKGRISMHESAEMCRAVRMFVKDAKCEALIVQSLMGLVVHKRRSNPCVHDENKSAAENIIADLSQLSLAEVQRALGNLLPLSVEVQGAKVKRMNQDSAALSQANCSQEQQGASKFAEVLTAAYGTKDSFDKGLEVLGIPHPDIFEKLRDEMIFSADSTDEFTAWNSGPNITTPEKEFWFVMDPFEKSSVCADKPPSEWKTRYEYGGNRTPIRRQVFLHAMGSKMWKCKVCFSNYKRANTLPQDDPQWLHTEEVSMVKVVLCRFIKSQLDPLSLCNAFKHARGLKQPQTDNEAAVRADKIVHALSKALHERDGSASTCTFDWLKKAVIEVVTAEELEALVDHFYNKLCSQSNITEPEVLALRWYTGPLFIKMNGSLRKVSGFFPEAMTLHLKGNTYVNLIYACSSGMLNTARASSIPCGRVVYRGMGGMRLPDRFLTAEEGCGKGGVDFGFVSTTTKKEVAVSYIQGKQLPVLFEVEVGDVDRGAPVSFLSQYPGEDEILVPPLSNLEVIGKPFLSETAKGTVTVYRVALNCNLKSLTIEGIQNRRLKELRGLVHYIEKELERDLNSVVEALAEDVVCLDESAKQQLDRSAHEIKEEFAAFREEWLVQEKSDLLNVDVTYKWAVSTAIDFKHVHLTKLVKKVCKEAEDAMCTHLHVVSAQEHVHVVQALLAAGADTAARDKEGRTSLMSALMGSKAFGLKWIPAGAAPPTEGRLLENPKLAEALMRRTEFTQQEWDSFGIIDLSKDDFIKAGKSYFRPAPHGATAELLVALTARSQALEFQDTDGRSALMLGALHGVTGAVRMMLEEGASTKLVDQRGRTSLMLALMQGHGAAGEELFEPTAAAGAESSILRADSGGLSRFFATSANPLDSKDKEGNTALHYASRNGITSIVEKLVQFGARVELTDKEGRTSFMLALLGGHKSTAEVLLAPTARVLPEGSIDIAAVGGGLGAAVAAGMSSLSMGALEVQDSQGMTALMHGSQGGVASVVQQLLSRGAKADTEDTSGRTSLALAFMEGHSQVADLLMESANWPSNEDAAASGDPSIMRAFSFATAALAALFVAKTLRVGVLNSMDSRNKTCLMYASAKGLVYAIDKMLKYGAKAGLQDSDGQTSLMLALEGGHEEAAELLAKPTALAGRINAAHNRSRRTAIMIASCVGVSGAAIEALLTAGAMANMTDSDGRSSLMLALHNGHTKTAEALVEPTQRAGALDIRDDSHRTALCYARLQPQHCTVVELLKTHGAKEEVVEEEEPWLLPWMHRPLMSCALFPLLSLAFSLLLLVKTEAVVAALPPMHLSWCTSVPELQEVDMLPAVPRSLLEAFDMGQIVWQLQHKDDNHTALLEAASEALGKAVATPQLLPMRAELVHIAEKPSLLWRFLCLLFRNWSWLLSILGITVSVGPIVLELSKPFHAGFHTSLQWISGVLRSIRGIILDEVLIPFSRQMHENGGLEAGLYFWGAASLAYGCRIADGVIAILVVSILGLADLHFAAAYSMRRRPAIVSILEYWDRQNRLHQIGALAMLWPAVLNGTQAVLHRSALLGYVATACALVFLQFNAGADKLCRLVDHLHPKREVASTGRYVLGCWRISLAGGICLLLFLVARGAGLKSSTEPFRSSVSVLGGLAHYLSLLILCTPHSNTAGQKWDQGSKLANTVMVISLAISGMGGMMLGLPRLTDSAIIFSFLWTLQRIREVQLYYGVVLEFWYLVFGASVSLYITTRLLRENPSFAAFASTMASSVTTMAY